MARASVPWSRSLCTRLLAISVIIAVGSVTTTAWLAIRTTTDALRHQQAQAVTDDAAVYNELVGYAATHTSWDGVGPTVTRLARSTGHRVTLTSRDRRPIAESARGGPAPSGTPTTVDPLAVNPLLVPAAASDRVDPRAVGPFALTAGELAALRRSAERVLACVHGRTGAGVIEQDPSGHPHVTTWFPLVADHCGASELDAPVKSERRALKGLNTMVNACLAQKQEGTVVLNLDLTWYIDPRVPSPASRSAQANTRIRDCVNQSRRAQLTPYVSPPALLFIGGSATPGFVLSPGNKSRVVGVVALVLLLTVVITVVAGIRLILPLRALTLAAQRITGGDLSVKVRVGGRDEIGRLSSAFNDMAEARVRMEALRKTMVSDIAHELRTPLSNVRGWLEAVEDGISNPDEELVSSLLEEALLLQRVIDDLQDLAMADAGQLRLHPEDVRLGDVLAQVAAAHRARAGEADVALTVRVEDDVDVHADPVRLRQVVGNLVSNALRHTPPGGTITVHGRRDGEWIQIDVTDTGSGIDAADLPHVFDRFWRAEKSRTRQAGGSGLGLPIVRKLAETHGGTVTAASEPGRGSTFTVKLPAG
ncbi:HAMP domain-containing sensor histidine kinase [Actinomadura sp. DC4]|uniref:sensor histidine kinase n=1 Tax=Actinomadura sp. DC4 TaxID=3055069 RepID=UPI0025AFC60B|nr:HAMP domain-containing sensor histidine kinase [Actinomadura sp. DC4]MDN3357291.1 HAMP domain-containing sensor histidine kinase [Actinomadura sp. DC4]